MEVSQTSTLEMEIMVSDSAVENQQLLAVFKPKTSTWPIGLKTKTKNIVQPDKYQIIPDSQN